MHNILKRFLRIKKANSNSKKDTEVLIQDFEKRISDVKVQLFELKKLKRSLLIEVNKQKETDNELTCKIKKILNDQHKDNTTKEEETKIIYSELKGAIAIQKEYMKQIKNIENSEKSIISKISQLQDIMVKYKVQNTINGIKKNNLSIMNDINTSSLEDNINYEEQFINAYDELSETTDELDALSNDDEYQKFIKNFKEGDN